MVSRGQEVVGNGCFGTPASMSACRTLVCPARKVCVDQGQNRCRNSPSGTRGAAGNAHAATGRTTFRGSGEPGLGEAGRAPRPRPGKGAAPAGAASGSIVLPPTAAQQNP